MRSPTKPIFINAFPRRACRTVSALIFAVSLLAGPVIFSDSDSDSPLASAARRLSPSARASSVYTALASSDLVLEVSAATANNISSNDDWSGVVSVEAYEGKNLSAAGTDPQTVLTTEFLNNALPAAGQTSVAANKGNPSAYNVGGIAEFDTGTELGIGLQGNVTADNPYIVFYLNTLGVSAAYMSYQLKDIDAGSNNAPSPVALQYRVGGTGLFTNIPAGYVAVATDGPTISGRISQKNITLPAAALGQAQVQVRIIAANSAGSDEWVGVNNVRFTRLSPSAAPVTLGGRVRTSTGMPVSKATVSMNDGAGNVRSTLSNSFGYFTFADVPAANTYIFAVKSRRYVFVSEYQVYTANEDFDGIDFIGYE
jgi:hypothetical protein